MSSKHKHPWDYPNCPSCESDVMVEGLPRHHANDYKCHACKIQFDRDYTIDDASDTQEVNRLVERRKEHSENTMRGKEDDYNYTFDLEFAKLLEFLQGYHLAYFKAYNLENDFDISRMKAGQMFTGLHERGLIERWTDGGESPWVLTDKGKEIDPMELVET